MTAIDYNNIIRNKIRDFIGSKNWSVSRFAKRYVDEFIELYSRQEAPSTSTVRKLVEEDGHEYTEREVTVLDSFTRMDFYMTWLEGQKTKVIELSNRYLGTDNGGSAIDSPAMLSDTLKKLNGKNVKQSIEDAAEVIRRFLKIDSRCPLLLTSSSFMLMLEVLKLIPTRFSPVKIKADGIDEAIDAVRELIESASRGNREIAWWVTDQYAVHDKAHDVFGDDLFVLNVDWSEPMTESLIRQKNDKTLLANRHWLSKRVASCVEIRSDWPELFRKMIIKSSESPWVRFPYLGNAGQYMCFIERKYKQMIPVFQNDELTEVLTELIENGLPEFWLTDECEPVSLLECIVTYRKWRLRKEEEISDIVSEKTKENALKALKYVDWPEFRALILWGNTKDYQYDSWEDWLEERYFFNMVEHDYYKVIDVVTAEGWRKNK